MAHACKNGQMTESFQSINQNHQSKLTKFHSTQTIGIIK